MSYSYFVSCAKLLEGLVREELLSFGITDCKETIAGVYFNGALKDAYRVCLWSRLANHVLFTLRDIDVQDGDELYDAVAKIDWANHLDASTSFRIDVTGEHKHIRHPHFVAQRAKDAIVDQCRDRTGDRPSIEKMYADVCLHIHVHGTTCTLSINLSGESLHKRGYRLEGGRAPLKETLAAAILYRAGWRTLSLESPAVLFDPMCGTGTLLIEAALIALDIAPGLCRDYFGFLGWKQHDDIGWQTLLTEAQERKQQGLRRDDVILIGRDVHPHAPIKTEENAERADVLRYLDVAMGDATKPGIPDALQDKTGLILCNPPYGERMEAENADSIADLFYAFGKRLQSDFLGWKLAVFSGAPSDCLRSIGFRLKRDYAFLNGALPCRLYQFDLQDSTILRFETSDEKKTRQVTALLQHGLSEGAQTLANRVKKNRKKWETWANKHNVSCYRVYDVDLPEYAVSVDVYENTWLHVQEYAAPKEIDPVKTKQHLLEMLAVLHQEYQAPLSSIFMKIREKQKGSAQYEKLDEKKQYYRMHEGNATFWVNFTDYLDTGIFLDHRLLRSHVASLSKDKRILNLFAYTCTASVQAALAGARRTTNVDLSNTYLEWGRTNFELNNIPLSQHDFIQADCLAWLADETFVYDIIFLNPPTFSNSKRMERTFDVDRDHVELITLALKRLAPKGILFFSTNAKNFKLDTTTFANINILDISARTRSVDFERRANMHHVWQFTV